MTDDEKAAISQAARELGRRGGSKGGKERARRLPPEERARIASNAAFTRWHPHWREHLEDMEALEAAERKDQ